MLAIVTTSASTAQVLFVVALFCSIGLVVFACFFRKVDTLLLGMALAFMAAGLLWAT